MYCTRIIVQAHISNIPKQLDPLISVSVATDPISLLISDESFFTSKFRLFGWLTASETNVPSSTESDQQSYQQTPLTDSAGTVKRIVVLHPFGQHHIGIRCHEAWLVTNEQELSNITIHFEFSCMSQFR